MSTWIIRNTTVLLLFSFSCLSQASYSNDTSSQRSYASVFLSPVTAILDVVCAPLHYMSTKSQSQINDQEFSESLRILTKLHVNGEDLVLAFEKLELSATAGHPKAMYHLGTLLLGKPSKQVQPLKLIIKSDHSLGMQYIEAAAKSGVSEAQMIWQENNGALRLEDLVLESLGLENDQASESFFASVSDRIQAVAKINPYGAYYLSEAILRNETSAYPWMFQHQSLLYERRKRAAPLLKYAVEQEVSDAKLLMLSLQQEDALYARICESIMQNPDRVIRELRMGDPGFLQSYIDFLCDQTIEERGYALSKDYACFIKIAMGVRVKQVFFFLGEFFSYSGIRYAKELFGEDHTSLHVLKVRDMANLLIGSHAYYLEPLTKEPYLKGVSTDFTNLGLYSAVTPFDVDRALDMLFEAGDDVYGDYVEKVGVEVN